MKKYTTNEESHIVSQGGQLEQPHELASSKDSKKWQQQQRPQQQQNNMYMKRRECKQQKKNDIEIDESG